MPKLSHLDGKGKAKMVDVSSKPSTQRKAVASGIVTLKPEVISLIKDNAIKKGDVLTVAKIAGIMAAKKTSELIPLCHPLAIDNVEVGFSFLDRERIKIRATVKTTEKTGVEMEALTAVSVSALTIYDMCKAYDKGIVIENIKLLEKSGGKSGTYKRSD